MTDLGVDNARGINDRGQIVGGTSFGTGFHAYLWQRGHITDLGVLSLNYSEAFAVNNRGWVAGNGASPANFARAFLWRHGTMTGFTAPPSGTYSEGRSVSLDREQSVEAQPAPSRRDRRRHRRPTTAG
jgi:probable HAF family extracellular repeat protein